MAFYLIKWTYFNGVSVGRNILIKNPFYEQLQEKMKQNWERQ